MKLPPRTGARLGRLVELSVKVGDTSLIVVAASELAPEEGERVAVEIPLERVHVFAAAEDGVDTQRLGAVGRAT